MDRWKLRKSVIIFGVDNSSSQCLEDATITPEAKYTIIFTVLEKQFVLSLHYNESDSFLFVNTAKICQFNAKNSGRKPYPLCLGNISKDFTFDNMKKTGLKGDVIVADYYPINISDILEIQRIFKERNII